jgi:RimJ/RimL family protein N-acetyltransferase
MILDPESENHPAGVTLRQVSADDLGVFFAHQLDPEANLMAGFTAKDPTDREAFMAHWAKIMADESVTIRTILYKDRTAGYILCHDWFGEPEVSYWIGKQFWGKGIATQALREFLNLLPTRPLYARAAKDNAASIRVLDKCGFRIHDEDRGYASARGGEIEEYILILE